MNTLRAAQLGTLDPRVISYLEAGVPLQPEKGEEADEGDNSAEAELEVAAMDAFLGCRAAEFWGYLSYLTEQSPFSTQQGIKGTEFERVLVIADDGESNHFQFSYDKYFGIKELSDTDRKNLAEGKDTQIEHTRRLFYVCCTRAMKDLSGDFVCQRRRGGGTSGQSNETVSRGSHPSVPIRLSYGHLKFRTTLSVD